MSAENATTIKPKIEWTGPEQQEIKRLCRTGLTPLEACFIALVNKYEKLELRVKEVERLVDHVVVKPTID
jgi:hypothetical protein